MLLGLAKILYVMLALFFAYFNLIEVAENLFFILMLSIIEVIVIVKIFKFSFKSELNYWIIFLTMLFFMDEKTSMIRYIIGLMVYKCDMEPFTENKIEYYLSGGIFYFLLFATNWPLTKIINFLFELFISMQKLFFFRS
ncbi:MAG: hypothetical protein ACRCW9_05895 [Cetobacterium sp.]